jgi:hypothetical protein
VYSSTTIEKRIAISNYLKENLVKSTLLNKEDIPEQIFSTEVSESEVDEELDLLLSKYQSKIEKHFANLAITIRGQDKMMIQKTNDQLRNLKTEILSSVQSDQNSQHLSEIIQNQLDRQFAVLTLRTELSEKIIRERVGEISLKDSDQDGITDYDEIHIYKTDPYSADTDNDGFLDGLEIIDGYDPLDPNTEAKVVFESPKQAGTLRDDLLKVTAITQVNKEITQSETENPVALISGVGLPNSFVTLFIYSNPIVVTVKTDANGNWSYIFDKEIEDGEHEIYVGVTDNAGKVVAKSEPARFIKTAQAFTPVGSTKENLEIRQIETPSLLNINAMLLVASASITSIGAILILLGLHLRTREKKVIAQLTNETSVIS